MNKLFAVCVLATGFALTSAQNAAAQVSTFMLVPGIAGGSTVRGHENWIDVVGLTQSFASVAGQKTTNCSIQVAKGLDVAGPKLWLAAVTGQLFTEIKIDVTTAGGDAQGTKLYEIRLLNARVLTIATSIDAGIAESLTLSANSIVLTFFGQRPDGSTGPGSTAVVSCN